MDIPRGEGYWHWQNAPTRLDYQPDRVFTFHIQLYKRFYVISLPVCQTTRTVHDLNKSLDANLWVNRQQRLQLAIVHDPRTAALTLFVKNKAGMTIMAVTTEATKKPV